MTDQQRIPISLEDVAEFHDQLRRLMRAGLRFDLGQAGNWPGARLAGGDLSRRLDLLTAHLANQRSRGRTIDQALTDAEYVSPEYRLALESWHYGQRSPAAFDALHQPARQRHELTTDLSLSLLHPLIVVVLCLIGGLVVMYLMAPKLESIYLQLGASPSRSLQWLVDARTWALVWVPVVIVGLVFVIWRWRRSAALPASAWSSQSKLLVRTRAQQTANGYAEIVEHSTASISRSNIHGANDTAADSLVSAFEAQLSSDPAISSSPMLQWTLRTVKQPGEQESSDPPYRYSAFRIAAAFYQQLLALQTQRRRSWLPVALSVMVGGTAVLLYALLLFPPIIALLMDIVRASQ